MQIYFNEVEGCMLEMNYGPESARMQVHGSRRYAPGRLGYLLAVRGPTVRSKMVTIINRATITRTDVESSDMVVQGWA